MSKEEIKIIECNTVGEAEAEYFLLQNKKCWQVIKPLKVVWSWRKFKTVVRFTVKKVDPKYYKDFMGDLKNAIDGWVAVNSHLSAIRMLRRERPIYKTPNIKP